MYSDTSLLSDMNSVTVIVYSYTSYFLEFVSIITLSQNDQFSTALITIFSLDFKYIDSVDKRALKNEFDIIRV